MIEVSSIAASSDMNPLPLLPYESSCMIQREQDTWALLHLRVFCFLSFCCDLLPLVRLSPA